MSEQQTEELNDMQALVELFIGGWDVRRASLFDEEGVEGWVWADPSGREEYVIGDWDGYPPLPESQTTITGGTA